MNDDVQLSVEAVTVKFGGNFALRDVSFEVPRGSVFGIIGPNGAGKSTLLNCINGFYRPSAGRIVFEGKDLSAISPSRTAALGIGRTFQNVELFAEATALENILLGRHIHTRSNLLSAALYWGPGRRDEVRQRRRVEEIIEFLEIESLRKQHVANLSYGQQKMVEVARALATDPRLLLLDEPTSGMNRQEKEDVARFILRLKHEERITQVLIEHDIRFIGDLCDHVVVLDFGELIAEGPPDDVLRNDRVVEAYLGVAPDAGTAVRSTGSGAPPA